MASKGGHDINYLSLSGMLSLFGKVGEIPAFPNNILADFAGGGSYGVIGILLALFEREKRPDRKGQVVDVAMHEAVGYMSSFVHNMYKN
jgi:alpha-methylacyl-CoA racemase